LRRPVAHRLRQPAHCRAPGRRPGPRGRLDHRAGAVRAAGQQADARGARPLPALPRARAGAAHRAAAVLAAGPVRLPGAVRHPRGVAPAPVRSRRRGAAAGRAGDPLQLPRQPAEHLHRQADGRDVRRRPAAGARDRGAAGAVASVGRRWAGFDRIPTSGGEGRPRSLRRVGGRRRRRHDQGSGPVRARGDGMAYYLGIDLGTTYTAAAAERDGVVESLTLGNRTASVPSVVYLRDDGEILVGEAATRRATTDPGRVAREFKRRVGDPTPIILGGTPYAAEMLMARLLRWSVDRVSEQQGEPPKAIALTHPANWGPYKLDLFTQAVRQVDLDAALMLAEPVAAATFYASQRSLDAGATVAVYDLGGGTFDAAVVRRTAQGFEIIGSPEGMERLGGIDFDEAVFAHVREAVGDALDALDPDEPAAQAAVARLRQECID